MHWHFLHFFQKREFSRKRMITHKLSCYSWIHHSMEEKSILYWSWTPGAWLYRKRRMLVSSSKSDSYFLFLTEWKLRHVEFPHWELNYSVYRHPKGKKSINVLFSFIENIIRKSSKWHKKNIRMKMLMFAIWGWFYPKLCYLFTFFFFF